MNNGLGRSSRLFVAALILAFGSTSVFSEDLSPELKSRIDKDRQTYEAGVKVTQSYPPDKEIKYWEFFLEAEPDHIYTPDIKKRIASLKQQASPAVPVAAAQPAAPRRGPAVELGGLLGGAIDLKDSLDAVLLIQYLSIKADRTADGGPGFFLPLTLGLATGLQSGRSVTTMSVTPSFEYDIPLKPKALYLTPTIGLSLGYQYTTLDFLDENVDAFNLAIPVGVGLKMVLKEHLVLRFMPVGVQTRFYNYTEGLGSSTNASVSYLIYGGAGYRF